ncbi:hypothetical protein ASPCADRAFT_208158 [Aspergillus carbonarius ITEM 5010]|uniref:Uncharacterized protein n=1 Tax=Aspergillus carbonarius (strain ITEM 5010) TaxID=602072 RepID=A0A1R3RJ37_ASPC5|nr:hypothetical protein ASPCADRAFT_208158 [Aspergillus carbonarius ITEM 5010]
MSIAQADTDQVQLLSPDGLKILLHIQHGRLQREAKAQGVSVLLLGTLHVAFHFLGLLTNHFHLHPEILLLAVA